MEDILDIKYGDITLIKKISPYIKPSGAKEAKGLFRCYCGKEFESLIQYVKSKRRTSCGCQPTKAHGLYKHTLYKRWENMMSRCYDNNSINYNNYGNKGITVIEEWKTFINFYNWSISNGWEEELSLDRKDGTKNYSPDNCRWVIKTVQSINQKLSKDNTTGYKGVNKTSYGSYRAYISVNHKQIMLGSYNTIIEAVEARNNYIIKNNLEYYEIQTIKN